MTTAGQYRERLHVPLRWWVQGSMFVVTIWLAMVVALPAIVAYPATAVVVAVFAALMLGYGSPVVAVDDGWLRVGRARIEGRHLGAIQSLDAEQTRRLAGVEADARAYLLLRPYLGRAVRVEIRDPRDPAPYWLVATRRPEQLAGVLTQLGDGQVH